MVSFFDPVPPFDDDEGCFRCQSEDGVVMHANFQAGIAPGGQNFANKNLGPWGQRSNISVLHRQPLALDSFDHPCRDGLGRGDLGDEKHHQHG
jgi:hypothetical protein